MSILIIFSCTDDKWKSFPENKFIGENVIDTTQYRTLGEIFSKKKITRPSYEPYSYYHFTSPQSADDKYVFIEKKHSTNKSKNVILKLDKKGNIIDSIVIDKYSSIINNYIMYKDYYISWFIDNDKTEKKFVNKNYFSKSDTLKIKSLVKELKKNKVTFYSTNEFSDEDNLDTCNYIISFKNNELVKFNYLKSIRPEYDLKIDNENPDIFSERFRKINMSNSEELLKVDNFFANSSYRLVRKGTKIHGSDLFSNTGIGYTTPCNTYKGTYFFSLLNLKIKIINQRICQNISLQESKIIPTIYTADFLEFYIIDLPFEQNDYYYLLKK